MKSTIRIKLTKETEQILFLLGKFEFENKKNVLDKCINNNILNNIKNKLKLWKKNNPEKINMIKNKLKNENIEYKSYALNENTKKNLKEVSQDLNINMSIVVSIALEDIMSTMMKISIDKKMETEKLLNNIAEVKNKINHEIKKIEKYVEELDLIYISENEKYPYHKEISLFLHGYHEMLA